MRTIEPARPARPSRLWLWFLGAFIVQLLMWGIWFGIAARHPVDEVPLVQEGGNP